MIIDIAEQIDAYPERSKQRQTERGELVTVTLQRSYPADAEAVSAAQQVALSTLPTSYARLSCATPEPDVFAVPRWQTSVECVQVAPFGRPVT